MIIRSCYSVASSEQMTLFVVGMFDCEIGTTPGPISDKQSA